MSGHKLAGCNWDGGKHNVGSGTLAILQDIRTELQRLNQLLHCPNFTAIPHKLDRIRVATARIPVKKRKKKVTT